MITCYLIGVVISTIVSAIYLTMTDLDKRSSPPEFDATCCCHGQSPEGDAVRRDHFRESLVMITQTITWHSTADNPPDDELLVLAHHPHWSYECLMCYAVEGVWHHEDGHEACQPQPTLWTDLPDPSRIQQLASSPLEAR